MGPKKAGKRLSTGAKGKGKRVSTGSEIEREFAIPSRQVDTRFGRAGGYIGLGDEREGKRGEMLIVLGAQ